MFMLTSATHAQWSRRKTATSNVSNAMPWWSLIRVMAHVVCVLWKIKNYALDWIPFGDGERLWPRKVILRCWGLLIICKPHTNSKQDLGQSGGKWVSSGKNAIIFSAFFFWKNQQRLNNDVDRLNDLHARFNPRQSSFRSNLANPKGCFCSLWRRKLSITLV